MTQPRHLRSFSFAEGPALLLLAGQKTASVRRRSPMTPKPGRDVRCTVRGRTIALAVIGAWEDVTFTVEQAHCCGHDTPDEMRAAVARFYPDETPDLLVVVHLTAIAPVCGHSLLVPGHPCPWFSWTPPT
jgi:hypothetical protein